MDIPALLTTALLLSGVVNRATEFFKALLDNATWDDGLSGELRRALVQAVAILAGIAASVAANFNILALVPAAADVPLWAGYIVTGFALSLGSDGLHIVLEILYASRNQLQAKAFATEQHVINETVKPPAPTHITTGSAESVNVNTPPPTPPSAKETD